jgi:iron-siderophore transport system permease protein
MLRVGAMSVRFTRRSVLVCGILALVLVALLVLALAVGDFVLAPGAVLAALTGGGSRASDFVVLSLRLPRALTALGAGAALGLAGAVFQSVTRNPLGSPDIIGFTRGASVGAVFALTVWHGDATEVALAAVAGGLLTSVAVYLLAFRGGVQGYRLVLVGIGVSALLFAAVRYLLTRADLSDSFDATIWLLGSLNGAGYPQAVSTGVALAVLSPVVLALSRRLDLTEMGDDTATALGVGVERSRLLALAAAVLLSAVATACVGPVSFVALSAPQLSRRLTRATGTGVVAASLMGALVLLAGDLIGQHALPTELPVGVVTGVVGGGYLAWLLAAQWRTRG